MHKLVNFCNNESNLQALELLANINLLLLHRLYRLVMSSTASLTLQVRSTKGWKERMTMWEDIKLWILECRQNFQNQIGPMVGAGHLFSLEALPVSSVFTLNDTIGTGHRAHTMRVS